MLTGRAGGWDGQTGLSKAVLRVSCFSIYIKEKWYVRDFKNVYKGSLLPCSLCKTNSQTLGTKCWVDIARMFSVQEERPGPPQGVGLDLWKAKHSYHEQFFLYTWISITQVITFHILLLHKILFFFPGFREKRGRPTYLLPICPVVNVVFWEHSKKILL